MLVQSRPARWLNLLSTPATFTLCKQISHHHRRRHRRRFVVNSVTDTAIETRTERRNWTELTRFSFWRTVQWASRASSLVIGWRVRDRSHVSYWRRWTMPTVGHHCLPNAHWSVLQKLNHVISVQFSYVALYAPLYSVYRYCYVLTDEWNNKGTQLSCWFFICSKPIKQNFTLSLVDSASNQPFLLIWRATPT